MNKGCLWTRRIKVGGQKRGSGVVSLPKQKKKRGTDDPQKRNGPSTDPESEPMTVLGEIQDRHPKECRDEAQGKKKGPFST